MSINSYDLVEALAQQEGLFVEIIEESAPVTTFKVVTAPRGSRPGHSITGKIFVVEIKEYDSTE